MLTLRRGVPVTARIYRYYSTQTTDHYETLSLKRNASRKEIKHAYYKLSKQFHPDINTDPTAQDKFRQIHDAYNVLGDERRKLEYDRQLMHRDGTPGGQMNEFTRREFKSRTPGQGPPTGKTNVYDFDEYYREHYGRHVRKAPHSAYSYRGSSTSSSQEDLNKYWAKRENEMYSSHNDDSIFSFSNKFFVRFFVLNLVLVAFYFFMSSINRREKEIYLSKSNLNSQNRS